MTGTPPSPSRPALDLPARAGDLVPDVRRIAVLRANGLGDYVVSEPALSALRAAYPAAEITLLGAAHHAVLLRDRPAPVDRVLAVPLVGGVRVASEAPDAAPEEVEAWCAEQRAYGYDLAVQLHGGGGSSNPLLLRLGARVSVGAATPDAAQLDRWVPYTAYQHDTVRWLEVVAAAGAGAGTARAPPTTSRSPRSGRRRRSSGGRSSPPGAPGGTSTTRRSTLPRSSTAEREQSTSPSRQSRQHVPTNSSWCDQNLLVSAPPGVPRVGSSAHAGVVMRVRAWAAMAAAGLALPLGLAGPAQAASPAKPYDMDGDGYPELVVGAPGLRVGTVEAAGGVVVLRASKKGLTTSEQVITQASRGVPGAAEDGDGFGDAVASADFDRDGFADLAIGAPGETVGAEERAGSVTLVRGSAAGLDLGTSRTITLAGSGRLGTALVAADLTGDGYPDLAAGSPGEGYVESPDDEDYAPVGVVHVFPGGPGGITTDGALLLRAARGSGGSGFDVGFGDRLAAARLDGDSTEDLVVGSRGARFVDEGYPGSVSVCLGHGTGPTGCTQVLQDAHLANMDVLAVGHVTGSTRPDIVVGTRTWSEEDTGRVNVLTLGDADAGALARRTEITQASPGVPGRADLDGFGAGLAVADLDHDGFADLVVGSPDEHDGRGRVTVVRGGADGYAATGGYTLDQSSRGVPGRSEKGDLFGRTLTLVDHDADGHLDLTVGVPGENADAGAVTTLRGAREGFTTKGATSSTLASLGYPHPRGAFFGSTLGRAAG